MKFPPLAISASNDVGTGSLELTGFKQRSRQTLPEAVLNGDLFYYSITSQAADQWEEGVGRIVAGMPATLERLRCIRSNNSDALCDFEGGQKLIAIVSPSILQAAAHLHKFPVRAVATANVSLSSDISDGDTLDGITLATGDRVLLVNQSTGSQNGIWEVTADTAVRPADFFTDDSARGTLVTVLEGTAGAGRSWVCTAATGADVIDTDPLTWQKSIADAADAILKDGSIAFTGDQSLGGHKLTDVATPTDSADAATKGYVDSGLAGKANSSHNHATGDITNLAEYIRDTMGAALVAGSNVTIAVDDGADTITIAATGGGGGSGDVATDVIWSAKGDLAVGTGDDTAIRLPVGTNGQVLTADSTQTGGMKWATPSGGGGGVSGPVSSTDRALALFDGVDGDSITDAADWTMSEDGLLTGKATAFPTVALTYDPDIVIDLNDGNNFFLLAEGDVDSMTIVNAIEGRNFMLTIRKVAGTETVALPENVFWDGGETAGENQPTLTTTAGRRDIIGFRCNGPDAMGNPWYDGFAHGLNRGYPPEFTTLLYDSFAGTDGTSIDGRTFEVGAETWTLIPGTGSGGPGDIQIQGNAAEAITESGITATADCGATDVQIVTPITVPVTVGSSGTLLAGTDVDNAYYCNVGAHPSGSGVRLWIYERSSGSFTEKATGDFLSASKEGVLTASKSGTTVALDWNGDSIEYTSATEHSGTLVGMRLSPDHPVASFLCREPL